MFLSRDHRFTIGSFLHIFGRNTLGSLASCDEIPAKQSKPQACISAWKLNRIGWFADSDWRNSEPRWSTPGLLARYKKSIVLWWSIMQKTIALSTAEYCSASKISVQIIFLCNLIRNMGLPQADDAPVYQDNTTCIDCGNHVIGGRERARHINIHKHFAHEVIQNRHMTLIRVPAEEQLAVMIGRHLYQGVAVSALRTLSNRTHGWRTET
jgi:hypothetical protein